MQGQRESVVLSGTFVDVKGNFSAQVEVFDGVIVDIRQFIRKPDYDFDDSHLIFPGMGDIHVHAREDPEGTQNYKEDYNTTEKAALNGGVTHVAVMPNTPQPLLSEELLEWHQNRCKSLDVHFLHYAGIGPGTRPLNSNVPYKVYTGPSIGPLFFKSEAELRETLQYYRGKPVSFHVEDYDVLVECSGLERHNERRPPRCVEIALKYVLKLIEEFELDAKLCHWSLGDLSLDLIKEHRERGFKTTIEVSPHHLFYDTDSLENNLELWPYLQMNPSLQGRNHRMGLIKGLKDGVIDYLATDHAPHTLNEKFKNFGSEENYLQLLKNDKEKCIKLSLANGVSGTPQLDTFGPFTTWLMKEHHFTASEICRVACENPGNFANKFHKGNGKFGKIEVGYYGNFTVINTKLPIKITRELLRTKVGWSPFEGVTFPGSVAAVFVKGRRILG